MTPRTTQSTSSRRNGRRVLKPAAFILAATAIACTPSALNAQDAQDERATQTSVERGEAIADRYVKVTGGKAAYNKIKNRVIEATLALPAQGLELGLTVYSARANKSFIIVKAPELGEMVSGTTDTHAWSNSLMAGPALKDGEENTTALRDATFDRLAHWRKAYDKVEYVGESEIDGKACHKVVMSRDEGKPQTFHYDQDSGLLVKLETVVESPAGEFPIESFMSDYKEVDGIQIAHKVRIIVMGQERIATTTSCKHNVELPKDRFDPPEEVQALINQQDGKG